MSSRPGSSRRRCSASTAPTGFRLAVSADGSSVFDGLIVDNANGIVDQPRLPRFKGYTNFDNYVAVYTWTKIAINNTEVNDQGAFFSMGRVP